MRGLSKKRFIAFLLTLAMLLPMLEGFSLIAAAEETEETVYVLAGSDFQDTTDDLSAENVRAILQNVYNAGYKSFDGFMFCGDYSAGWEEGEIRSGLAALKAVVGEKYPNIPNQFYVQGNHDGDYPLWTASTGHDTDAYSVFVLNEDDFNWYQTDADETRIKNKAAELKSFLDQHVVGEKPIFVLSHVPLHYSWRTANNGDAQYAKYIVDVLNEAGQRGLNIIFMYGHNHGGGLDNYLGGSSNFIAKGDTMYIANPLSNVSPSVEYTINFTYMNAGMVGYYNDTDYDQDGYHVDGALTMSVFAITGDEVVVRRFCGGTTVDSVTKEPYCTCSDGKHALKKCAGDWYGEADEAVFGYQLNTKTYDSPYTIQGSHFALTVPSSLGDNTFTVGSSAVVSAAAEEGYKYTWESSDPFVVSVSAMNSVTALLTSKSEGSAKITVTKSATTSAKSTSVGDSTSFYVQVTAGEGVVVEDSGEKIFRRTQSFKHGKRYIITNWATESWELNDVKSMLAPSEGHDIGTHPVTIYMYPDGVPFLTADSIPANKGNIWRFETSGNGLEDQGYLISEHTGYDQTKRWYVGLAAEDKTTLWVTDSLVKGGYLGEEGSGKTLYSAQWTWSGCIQNVEFPTFWLGYNSGAADWQSIDNSAWTSSSHANTYIYEETNNVATATMSDKVGYVSVGATSLPTMIIKTWTSGKVEYIPLTLSMLSTSDGSAVTTGTAGIYSNLTVTYNGVIICNDYTLAVGTESTGANTEGKFYYRLVDNFTHGMEYLIVSRNTAGKAYALASAGFNANATTAAVALELDANGIPCVRSDISVPATAVWKYYNDDTGGPYWLEQPTTLWNSGTARNYLSFNNVRPNNDNEFFNGKGSLLYSGDWYKNWPVTTLTFVTESGINYPALKGLVSLSGWYNGTYAYITFDKHDAQFVTVGDDYRKWGEEVYLFEKTPITSVTYEALGTTGKVIAGDPATTKVGTSVEIRYPDGNVQVVPVTANMLSLNGTALEDKNLTTAVRMTGLTLKYQGQTLSTNFTLDVQSEQENDYPEFPAPGSVRVGKHLGKSDYIFNRTGVANVELTVNGAPKQTPMDVLVILDTSSSVVDNFMENGETRLEVMRQALGDLIETLQAPNPDGTMPDVCLAVSQFNDYTYFSENNGLSGFEIFTDRGISPEYNEEISGFMNVHEMDNFDVSQIQAHGGTNYDVAFQVAYEMLEARKQEYATIGNREQIVVFMTDGICFQYNYLSYRHGAADNLYWEKWMTGGLTDDELNTYVLSDAFKALYRDYGSGKHWMAEAIKGKTEDDLVSGQMMYPVIWNENRDSGEVFDPNEHYQLKQGLGATIYSIGFGIDVDGEYNSRVGKQVLSNIASNPNMYYDANDKQDLRQAFSDIGRSVRKAATDAYMKDQMGKYFDLQMGDVKTSEAGKPALAAPSITIKTYDLYKTSEVGTNVGGVFVTEEMVGTRKSSTPAAVLETISFSADGKTVTSSALSSANILSNGVISGKYFYYNTSKTDTKDIVVNGQSVSLEPETIYWYIGDIIEQEVVLSYYVYLEDSLAEDGVGREAGTYDTNNFADLHYINFNDVRCTQSTQSPKLPWETATVGYAFYLVDENGNIITNQATGETGGFANRIPVTNVVTNELLLNVDSDKYNSTITASSVLPNGYTLYDPDASYVVHVNSGDVGGEWEITSTSGKKPTTYVTGYHGSDFTTEQTSSNTSYDYSHTTVWFAVKYTVQALPDVVVIDYGLPVDVHLLRNDLFPTAAAVDGIFFGKVDYTHKSATETNQPAVADTANGAFGTAKLDKANGILRYTLNTTNGMQMNQEEVFTYRVPYDYTTMTEGVVTVEKRYYYSTVTVIPAANIYYEDNFFTFTNSTAMDGDIGKWIPGGSIGDETQAEDRPGTDSKFEIDADNVYGYDSVNGSYEEYSLDTYHKVSVNQATGSLSTAPAVKFTFTGTGFDLISLTNSDSGLITVEVNGPEKKNLVVDNYYGYTYSDGKWIVDQDASDCLYQVPVIKVDDLAYGTYNVTVRVAYMGMFDHQDDGSYSFWMDAVRIYNPVDTGKNDTVADAYEKDQESNPCFEMLRDILVGAKTFHADGSAGAVFIDGKLNNGASVSEYANFGPNNEVYLAGGQTIAFKLVTNTNPTNIQTVQIGAKLAKGSNAQLYYGTKELVTLNTATNMFYKLDNVSWKETVPGEQWTSGTIVLTHNTAGATTQNIISLTDVKITSKVPIALKTDTAVAATELLSNTEGPAIILYADSQTVEYAAAVMNAIESESDDITGEEPDSVPVALAGKSFSLSFENQVLVNFYYTVSDMTDVAEHGMLVFYSDPGTVDIANADVVYNEPVHVESLGCYMATSDGIAAKEMGDTRYYVAYAKLTDGSYVYSAAYDYSPKKYSMNMLGKESTSDKQKALCVAMLNYGAAAQEYFGYNTDSLMNAELTAEQQALVVAFDAGLFTGAVAADASKTGNFTKTSTGFSEKSATVSFDGALCVNYYFTPSATVNGDMMLYIWTPDVYAAAETLTAENAETMTMVAGFNGGYWGQVSGIAAKNLDDTYYVAGVYTDADGNTYCTGVIAYSLSRYCLNKAVDGNEMQELASATAMYGYYAKSYFAA